MKNYFKEILTSGEASKKHRELTEVLSYKLEDFSENSIYTNKDVVADIRRNNVLRYLTSELAFFMDYTPLKPSKKELMDLCLEGILLFSISCILYHSEDYGFNRSKEISGGQKDFWKSISYYAPWLAETQNHLLVRIGTNLSERANITCTNDMLQLHKSKKFPIILSASENKKYCDKFF